MSWCWKGYRSRAILCLAVGLGVCDPNRVLAQGLSVTIGHGRAAAGKQTSFYFPNNTAVVPGGSGNYSYVWTGVNGDYHGPYAYWNNSSTGEDFVPEAWQVSGDCTFTNESYTVTVTDQTTGATATSNKAVYSAVNETPAKGLPPGTTEVPPIPGSSPGIPAGYPALDPPPSACS